MVVLYSSSFEMNRQQTYRGSSFHIGWMRGTLEYDTSLSLKWTSLIIPISACYYYELHNAIVSYLGVQFLLLKVQ